MKTKEIYKYPYNVRPEDEIKVFISDRIYENVQNRRIIVVSAGFILTGLFGMPHEVDAIGLPPRGKSATKIYRPGRKQFQQHAPTINLRLDKILMPSTNRMIPVIYLNGHYCYINDHLLKKLRAGDLYGTLSVVTIGVVIYIMCQLSGVDAFVILRELGKFNAPRVDPRSGLNRTYSQPSSRTVPESALEITRPTAMPHQEFVDLPKEERRQVPHPYDKIIHVEGHPRLQVGF